MKWIDRGKTHLMLTPQGKNDRYMGRFSQYTFGHLGGIIQSARTAVGRALNGELNTTIQATQYIARCGKPCTSVVYLIPLEASLGVLRCVSVSVKRTNRLPQG
jgi:hypothetical protein